MDGELSFRLWRMKKTRLRIVFSISNVVCVSGDIEAGVRDAGVVD